MEKGPAASQIALTDLTKTQRVLLEHLRGRPFWRVRNGWRQPGNAHQVSLETGSSLMRAGLAEQAAGSLRLTPLGRLLAEEASQHTRKRVKPRTAGN